jgi:hypothetical protein
MENDMAILCMWPGSELLLTVMTYVLVAGVVTRWVSWPAITEDTTRARTRGAVDTRVAKDEGERKKVV